MPDLRAAAVVSLLAVFPGPSFGQSPDPAAERARLGNERIQAEAERMAREELERQKQAASAVPAPIPSTAPAAAGAEPARPPAGGRPAEPGRPPAGADPTERGLEQLRELGKLKDAGYLTDAEFQRIKQKILDAHF
jgi:hypothetical protein